MRQGVIYQNDEPFQYYAWPSVAKLPDGTLAVVCSGKRYGHICPFGKVTIFYSRDEGRTWSAPKVLIDTPLDDRDAGIVVGRDGKVIVTTFNNSRAMQRTYMTAHLDKATQEIYAPKINSVTDEEEAQYLGASYCISQDGGYTFGPLKRVPLSAPHGMTVLNDGSYLYVGSVFYEEDGHGNTPVGSRLAYCTSSDGESFSQPVHIDTPEELGLFFCEPHAVQLPSGRIVLAARAQQTEKHIYRLYTCYSDDGCRTFSPWKLVNRHGVPPHLLVHSTGVVILTYGYREPPFGQRVRLSRDGGATWGPERVICDNAINGDIGYPASVELSDGHILTVYYQKPEDARNNGIFYTIWSIDE